MSLEKKQTVQETGDEPKKEESNAIINAPGTEADPGGDEPKEEEPNAIANVPGEEADRAGDRRRA